ncbi:Trihelix transcription factor PTL [Vitis vinifera]|uniref:Trihelix transcription factor PTL n=1 Tax=Vitis vinifera TaxID=29760 RepID=A0A438FKR0_VITVI|nr:Trihelix transcription factor PTL [Vitis vinifera]
MAEEHGYQRSGKKCREKFENLYKYYKKTKEGKAGRQDGKHYRFFRQLEALYGETSNQASVSETHLAGNTTLLYQTTNNTTINQANQEALQDHKFCESHSFSNSSEFETSSSENNDDDLSAIAYMMNHSMEKKRGIMDTQEAWMEKMLTTIEHKEQERLSREEEWRKQEAARFDREYKFWASERAWIEARDAALMEALKNLQGKN